MLNTPWQHYWSNTNSLGTFGTGELGLPEALVEYWQGLFTNIKQGAHVLDVGTGNGVIAYLAQTGIGETAKVTGVDFAQIDPSANVTNKTMAAALNRIHFIANTAIQDFQTEQKFDLITSNYAIEYAPLEQALRHVNDLLAADGQFVGIIHLKGGFSYNESADGLAIYRDLLAKLDIDRKLAIIVDPKNLANSATRQRLFMELTAELETLKGSGKFNWLMEVMQPVANICQSSKNGQYKKASGLASEFCLNKKHLISRLEQQLAASCTLDELDKLCQKVGLIQYALQPLSFDDKPVAIELVFKSS